MAELDRRAGREAFGADPANYHHARPAYPAWVFDLLADRCGLAPGCATLEIGAGTGLATQELLARGADPLVAIEPDPRLADFLAGRLPHSALEVRRQPFEESALDADAFDLACAFTSFHWLDPEPALEATALALRPGGAVALVWNVFGDADRPDPFHDATVEILRTPTQGVSDGVPGRPVFALDTELRTLDLRATGFTDIAIERSAWTLELDADGVRRLYATYSNVVALPAERRRRVFDELADVVDRQFDGRVTRNMVTIAYTARQP